MATEPSGFRFVDVFAGIGGFHLGLRHAGGKCVLAIEYDKHARETYRLNFGREPEVGDIAPFAEKVARHVEQVPDHEILVGGFPCQPFSIAGVSKKASLGRAHGFEDATQGTLFFEMARLIEASRPPIVLLENVRNLLFHNGGETFRVIEDWFSGADYSFKAERINAVGWVPQHRERLFMVALDRRIFGPDAYDFPPLPTPEQTKRPLLSELIELDPLDERYRRYVLSDRLWAYLQEYADRQRAKGNGFGFGLVDAADPHRVTRTLSARYYKDGSEILIDRGFESPGSDSRRRNPRRLAPSEARAIMGFPPEFIRHPSDIQAYRQFGNAVVPPVVTFLASDMVKTGLMERAAQARRTGAAANQRQEPGVAMPPSVATAPAA